MLSKVSFKKVLLGFFVATLIIHLLFIFVKEQPPVMWDARIYSSCAVGLLDYVQNGGTFGHPERFAVADTLVHQAEFMATMEKYIKGEWIEWLYYSPPTMAEAQEYIFLSGPVYPALLAAVFAVDWGVDFVVVRIINCVLDSLSAMLLMLVAYRLFGRRAALLAGGLFIIYIPFFIQCGVMTPDILTTFLILLTIYLILQYYDGRKAIFIYLTGLCLGLLALNKPTAALLFVPVLAGFLYDERSNFKKALTAVIKAALPFLLVMIPWVAINSTYYGELSIRDPQYSDANFRSSSSIKYEGYDLDYTEPDFWTYPVSYTIKEDPAGYAHLLIKKFFRLWQKPYNDFKESFVIGPEVTRVFHVVIVLAGLFGAFYCFIVRKPGLLFLFLIPVYYSIVHVVFHSLPRYNLNAMPLVMVAGAAVFIGAYESVKDAAVVKRSLKLIGRVALIATGLILAFVLPVSWGAALWGGKPGAILAVIIKAAFLLMALYGLYRLLTSQFDRLLAFKMVIWPALILMATMPAVAGAADNWAEWKTRLTRPEQRAVTRIYVGDGFRLGKDDLVRIGIDVTALRNKPNEFNVTVNGNTSPFIVGEKKLMEFYYSKYSYRVFEKELDFTKADMRYWSFVLIGAEAFNILLDRDGFIQVELGIGKTLSDADGYLDLYGNYNTTVPDHWYIPGVHYSSVERLVEKGDPRIWQEYKLSSDSAISYYIDDFNTEKVETGDLSPNCGRQTGRYRVIVEVMRLDKNRYYF